MLARLLPPLLLISCFIACGGGSEDGSQGSISPSNTGAGASQAGASQAGAGQGGAGLSGAGGAQVAGQGGQAGSGSGAGQGGAGASQGGAGQAGAGAGGAGQGGAGAQGGAGQAGQGAGGQGGGISGNSGQGGAGAQGGAGQAGKGGASTGGAGQGGAGQAGKGGAGQGGAPVVTCGAAQACGPAVCGNGKIDSCEMCSPLGGGPEPPPPPPGPWGAGGGPCQQISEACDGADLGGQTCESLGWGSGKLGCLQGCGLDLSGCVGCAAASGEVPACVSGSLGEQGAEALALATHGADLSIAWADAAGAWVATLDDSLQIKAKAGPFVGGQGAFVALTPLASGGWLLASGPYGDFSLTRLDASLGVAQVGARKGYFPHFGAREAGPMLMYADGQGKIAVEVLDGAGNPSAGPTAVTESAEAEYANAVFDGATFWVAQRGNKGAQIFRVSVSAVVEQSLLLGSSTEYPQVAADAGVIRATYNDFGQNPPSVSLVSLDKTAKIIGSPAILGTIPSQFNMAPLVQRGDSSVILLGGYTGETGAGKTLDVTTFSGNTTAPAAVARGTHLSRYRLLRRDGDAISAWITHRFCGGSIELARIAH